MDLFHNFRLLFFASLMAFALWQNRVLHGADGGCCRTAHTRNSNCFGASQPKVDEIYSALWHIIELRARCSWRLLFSSSFKSSSKYVTSVFSSFYSIHVLCVSFIPFNALFLRLWIFDGAFTCNRFKHTHTDIMLKCS